MKNTKQLSIKFNGTDYLFGFNSKGGYWLIDFAGTHYIDDCFDDEERRRLEAGLNNKVATKLKKLEKK